MIPVQFDNRKMLEAVRKQDGNYAEGFRLDQSTLVEPSKILAEVGLLARVCERFQPRRRDRLLLEVGCGIGTLSPALKKLGRRLYGFDLSAEAIRQAKVGNAGDENLIFFVGDGTSPVSCPELRGLRFDAAVFREFHPFTRDFYASREEASRVHLRILEDYANILTPGGLCLVLHGAKHAQTLDIGGIPVPQGMEVVLRGCDPRVLKRLPALSENRGSVAVFASKLAFRILKKISPCELVVLRKKT